MNVVDLLRGLVRIDTSNPPGAETPAAEYLKAYLEAAGLECELVAKEPTRANLIARLRGRGDGPTLAFMGHLDVVPARPERWSVYPFSGELRDGAVWGRGTVDMKCWLAASAAALAELARDGFRPNGDLLLLATVDEEQGDAKGGVDWLVQERPDIRAEYAVNEGAGERFEIDGTPYYTLAVGEKATSTAHVRLGGRPGDPALRASDGNAVAALAPLLERLARFEPAERHVEEAQPLLGLASNGSHPLLDAIVPSIVRTAITATQVRGGTVDNMIPDEAELTLALRVVPGTTKEDIERELREALGPAEYELEVEEPLGGTRSPLETPLRDAVAEAVAEHEPNARLAPTLGLGFTCSHYMREAFGTVAYGFIPFRHQDPLTSLETKHGDDERILVADLELQRDAAATIARRIGQL